MSWIHVAWASKQVAGGGTNKLVLLMIADATSHDSPMLVAKVERLSRLCELNEKTVRNALRDLEERGLIGTVLRYFEGQQISNGYFLMGEEWVEAAKERIRSENYKDGFSCKLKIDTEPPSGNHRTPFDERPAPNAALGGAQMPGGAGVGAGQIQPSLIVPSLILPSSPAFASLTSAESSQQSENTAGEQSAAPTQTLASSQISSAQPQIEALATRPASKRQPAPTDSVAASIYALYPRKVARAAALKAIKKALVENPDIDMSEAVTEYAKATSTWKESDKTYIPYPASWFNGGCFLDDRNEWWKKSTTSPVISRGRRI